MMGYLQVSKIENDGDLAWSLDAIILAAGFEDRALAFLNGSRFKEDAHCILVLFDNDSKGNESVGANYLHIVNQKFRSSNVIQVTLKLNEIIDFSSHMRRAILSLPANIAKVGVDISGLPAYAIFATLEALRGAKPYAEIPVIYSSAEIYVPTKEDYNGILDKFSIGSNEEINLLPKSMAKEMADNLVFAPFSGHRTGDGNSCLVLFAGYEPHRSAGVIDAINPTILLLIYGNPSDLTLSWRLEFSRRLHGKFERTRRCAIETVETQKVSESLELLERYYNYLIDDFDLVIAPVCSKMQVIATFLFWERYPEVQVTFPIPIGYDPDFRPRGVGDTFSVTLPGRLRFG